MPQVGHLMTTIELAKLLLGLSETTEHRFSITVVSIPPFHPSRELTCFISATAAASVPNLSFLLLPPIDPPPLPPSTRYQAFVAVMLDLYKPLVRSTLQTLSSSTSPIAALVLDFFCSNMVELGLELGIPPYVFFTSGTSFLGFLLQFPEAADPLLPTDGNAADVEGVTIPVPGFSSALPLTSLPDAFCFGKDDAYRAFLDHGRRLKNARGFLVNSFDELQSGPQDRLVYNIGPLLSLRPEPEHECLGWLDRQPCGSVVFLCFGSLGRFSKAQVVEIAVGLERSGHRFLWVLREPTGLEGAFGRNGRRETLLDVVLPDGFVGRVGERGLVWPSFAPQWEILGHAAVGGFVSHCGWNSCLESIWFGVPMAAWPLYAEQHFNAHEMVRERGVAVEVTVQRSRGNWAPAEEVERAVRLLMGDGSAGVREKVRELKEAARRAVEEGGSSYCALRRAAAAVAGGHRVGSAMGLPVDL